MAQINNRNRTSQPKKSECDESGDTWSEHTVAVVLSTCRSAHQSLDPQNSLQKLVIRTRFCSHCQVFSSFSPTLKSLTSRCRLRRRWICFWWVGFRSERGEEQNSVRNHGENYDFYQHRAAEIKVSHLLWVMWLLTRCPAARAAIRESSPASTVPQTTRASWRAFSPGSLELEPWTPSIYRRRERRWATRRRIILLHIIKVWLHYRIRNISEGFHLSICNL